MGILDIFKKSKNKKNKTVPNIEPLDEFYSRNESYIFRNILWNDIQSNYTDESIYDQCVPNLRLYFEENGYSWNKVVENVKEKINSSMLLESMNNKIENNYNYYLNNKIDLKFDGYAVDWIKYVYDYAKYEHRFITKQYARLLVGSYYYDRYYDPVYKSEVYKNILIMMSVEDLKKWVIRYLTFDNTIELIKRRFQFMGIKNVDSHLIAEQFLNTNQYKVLSNIYPFFKESLANSKYLTETIDSVPKNDDIEIEETKKIVTQNNINKSEIHNSLKNNKTVSSNDEEKVVGKEQLNNIENKQINLNVVDKKDKCVLGKKITNQKDVTKILKENSQSKNNKNDSEGVKDKLEYIGSLVSIFNQIIQKGIDNKRTIELEETGDIDYTNDKNISNYSSVKKHDNIYPITNKKAPRNIKTFDGAIKYMAKTDKKYALPISNYLLDIKNDLVKIERLENTNTDYLFELDDQQHDILY